MAEGGEARRYRCLRRADRSVGDICAPSIARTSSFFRTAVLGRGWHDILCSAEIIWARSIFEAICRLFASLSASNCLFSQLRSVQRTRQLFIQRAPSWQLFGQVRLWHLLMRHSLGFLAPS